MKVLLTGGGSAGHVTPNLALVPYLEENGAEIYYIGSKDGIEKGIIEENGIPYYGISSGKFRRYFSLKNFTDPFRIIKGYREAKKYIKELKPDVLFSKGGYVSVPVVYAAKKLNIPIVIHESDYTPGLANKLSLPKAEKICLSFESAAKDLPKEKCIVTGAPIRSSILEGDRNRFFEHYDMDMSKPVLLIMGGSLGALAINNVIDENIDYLLDRFNIVHIRGKDKINEELLSKPHYVQIEYINEGLEDIFAAADYMISRSGSNAIFEILALKIPNLLIPLPLEASRGDQILNARFFEEQGYSLVLMQNDITKETFISSVEELVEKGPVLKENMEKSPLGNGAKLISETILEAAK